MVERYERLPVMVDVVQLKNSEESIWEVCLFVHGEGYYKHWIAKRLTINQAKEQGGLELRIPIGFDFAPFGDWIIREESGLFSHCNAKSFAERYRSMEEKYLAEKSSTKEDGIQRSRYEYVSSKEKIEGEQ